MVAKNLSGIYWTNSLLFVTVVCPKFGHPVQVRTFTCKIRMLILAIIVNRLVSFEIVFKW